MRTPKEVITKLVEQMGQDPFGDSIEDMIVDINREYLTIERAKEKVKHLQARLQAKRDYDTEREATLEYIKELKDV